MKAAVLAAATLAATAIIACSGGLPKTHPTLAPPPIPINQEAADRRVEELQRAILEQIAQRPSPAVPEETIPAGPTETVPDGIEENGPGRADRRSSPDRATHRNQPAATTTGKKR